MLFANRIPLKNYRGVYNCTNAYHTSLKTASVKRILVPEQFLNLAETTGYSSTLKKTAENISKQKRKEKDNIFKKEYLYGISPCLAALEANRRKFFTIYFNNEALNKQSRPQFKKIRTLATGKNIPIKSVSRKRLDDLCRNRPHQNVVVKVTNLSMVSFKDDQESDFMVDENRPLLWLILQGIQDPMNLGAILRTAVFLGVDKIVCSQSDSCPLTPAVSKASAGAMESLPVYTTNVRHLLKRKREENHEILGTVGPYFVPQGNSIPVVRTTSNKLKLEKPSLLVLGNEGKGLPTEIQRLCTKFVAIPAQKVNELIELDSLNVSVATGIILHSLLSNTGR